MSGWRADIQRIIDLVKSFEDPKSCEDAYRVAYSKWDPRTREMFPTVYDWACYNIDSAIGELNAIVSWYAHENFVDPSFANAVQKVADYLEYVKNKVCSKAVRYKPSAEPKKVFALGQFPELMKISEKCEWLRGSQPNYNLDWWVGTFAWAVRYYGDRWGICKDLIDFAKNKVDDPYLIDKI